MDLIFQDLWLQKLTKFDQTDQEQPSPIYLISGHIECEKNQEYYKVLFVFFALTRPIFTNPLFFLDSKGSLDQYLINDSAWVNLRTQIHGMLRHSIR